MMAHKSRLSPLCNRSGLDASSVRLEPHIEERISPELDFTLTIPGVKLVDSYSFRCKSFRVLGAKGRRGPSHLLIPRYQEVHFACLERMCDFGPTQFLP